MLKALYIDDSERDQQFVKIALSAAWHVAFPDLAIEIESVDFDRGSQLIEAEGEFDYDVAFVDILDAERNTPGFTLIRAIRHAVTNGQTACLVIAITSDPHQLVKAESFGADASLAKGHLEGESKYGPEILRKVVVEAGITVGGAEKAEVNYDSRDLGLCALLESVGEDTIKRLIAATFQQAAISIDLKPIQPGLSGAFVVGCDCKFPPDSEGGRSRKIVLKGSRDAESMRHEEQRWQSSDWFAPTLMARRVGEPAMCDGWNSLAFDFLSGETLTSWLARDRSEDEIANVFAQLYAKDRIPAAYAESSEELDLTASAVLRERCLGSRRQANIKYALDRLQAIAGRHLQDAEESTRAIERFLTAGAVDSVDDADMPKRAFAVRSHGDMHARNLMVMPSGQIWIIDPANIRRDHWAADWARLTIDILACGISGLPDAHEWSRIEEWRSLFLDIVEGNAITESDLVPPGPLFAVSWMRSNVGQIFQQIDGSLPNEWELRLALAVELMRGSYREHELSTPLRVLSIAAAHDALVSAARVFEQSGS